MNHISEILPEVLSRLQITKEKNGEAWGHCPFHDDKHPSFSVNIETGAWYCFACAEGGSVHQLAVKMGLKPEGTFQPFKKRSKPKAIQPWQRARRIGESFDAVEDVYKEAYRQKRNILEKNWNEGRITESKYYAKRQIIDYQFDTLMEVNGENRNRLTWEAKRGNA